MSYLKTGGWCNVGDFMTIEADLSFPGGARVQVVSRTSQLDAAGTRRSRRYFQLRTGSKVINLPGSVKSKRAAMEAIADHIRAPE